MIKLYVAILSKGWWRAEICTDVIPQMMQTKNVVMTLRNPSKSWAVPVANNRNIIRKDFLETDNNFLLMIDHDVVPLSNPAELVFADKDIIGMPVKIRQAGKVVNWNAYIRRENDSKYMPIDFSRVDPTVDLLKLNDPPYIGAVGTGCILIRRNVLEAIPCFEELRDEFGIVTVGEDINFCESANRLGFEIFTTPRRRCEHFHEVGLYDFLDYEDSDGYFFRRETLSGKKCIIGLSAWEDDCEKLAQLLNFQSAINCTYRAYKWSYIFDEASFMIWFPKILLRNNYNKIPSDVSPDYIEYVEYIINKLELDAKFICLIRDDDKSLNRNFYKKAIELTNKFPDKFAIFNNKNLYLENDFFNILNFLDISKNDMRFYNL